MCVMLCPCNFCAALLMYLVCCVLDSICELFGMLAVCMLVVWYSKRKRKPSVNCVQSALL